MIDESTELEGITLPLGEDRGAQSDEALAARGDAGDFILLYRRYLRPVYRYLYARLGGNRHETEDVTSVVFERVWTSLPGYKPAGSFRGWLFTIASRTLADHYRSGSRYHGVPLETVRETLVDSSDGPEESALREDQLRGVLGVIASLGEEQREVIALRFMAGLRYGEIATVLKKREAAVKMVAYRALDEVRRRYRDGEF